MLRRSMTKKRKTRKSKTSGALAVQPSAAAFAAFKAAGVAIGVDARAMERLVARLQGRSLSAKGGRLTLDDRELLSLVDDGIARSFQVLDAFALGQASARDVATIIGILTDKRRLLRDEPTAIMKFQDMRKMDEILESVAKELKRRGKVIDVTPEKDSAVAPVANAGNGSVP